MVRISGLAFASDMPLPMPSAKRFLGSSIGTRRLRQCGRTPSPVPTAGDVAKLATHEMQCVDCHNRPAHAFELPERAVNRAIASGEIAASLPFVKKKSMELLKAAIRVRRRPHGRSSKGFADYYRSSHPEVFAQQPGRGGESRESRLGDLCPKCLSRSQGHLGHIPEQPRAYRFAGLLSMPRRWAYKRR